MSRPLFKYMQLTISSIEYNKKPGKPAQVKVIKDPAVPRDDLYKSSTVHTGPESRLIPYQSPRQKGNRLQQSPSPRASFCDPAALAALLQSSPVAPRNRELYPHLPPHNPDQCLLLGL
jgi:myosin-1